MKKLLLVLAVIFSAGYATPVQALSGSFNEGSYNKVTALSAAIEAFAKVSANGELSVLATRMVAIKEKAADLSSYDIKAEALSDNNYAIAADELQQAAIKIETVSKKMAEAAQTDDDMLFVSYKDEYNNSVNAFNKAINNYGAATEQAAERVKFEQAAIIASAVLAGVLAIVLWFWASSNDEAKRARARLRRWVAIASLLPFVGALTTVGLYLFKVETGYIVWIPVAFGVIVLVVVWIIYLVRQRRLSR